MKKQIIHISILQSSKIMTAMYALFGFIYTLIAIPMIIFGQCPASDHGNYLFLHADNHGPLRFYFLRDFRGDLQRSRQAARRSGSRNQEHEYRIVAKRYRFLRHFAFSCVAISTVRRSP